ncbi:MAG TPA: iron-containing redox enzyme family protein [Jatrophihabitans sp.]|uniref:iron-containing redox enzyme family protein n=1 Tax=Jatrophihabitans sp. TaxID=1932789 RepID=UPI002F02B7E0
MRLPAARGPLTDELIAALRQPAGSVQLFGAGLALDSPAAALSDDDLQLGLWICYELHYAGFTDAEPGWEWEPELMSWTRALEGLFGSALRSCVSPAPTPGGDSIADRLRALVDADDGPALSRHLQSSATVEEFREFVTHRSLYHLKEADPHSWAIPRLRGKAKAALIEIQFDEYGAGSLSRMHSELFRTTMRSLGLDDSYGCYLDQAPGVTLAISNLMSYFGLHRENRGALVGHLAAFEMTSSMPNRRYGKGLRRLGGDAAATRFYDEHVTADALHEQLAAHDLCGSVVADEPDLADDVLFGAACALHLDNLFAAHLLRCWASGRSSLRVVETERLTGYRASETDSGAVVG